ncbi:hypothetical protein TBLA_0A06300 [Henningerozyma blattae CBS 6284]|uniref:Uncharacterized protein n=1 Tax=Henningerozyma blattae (strain ATCC 34711 / CBS 6284 / DSM 70876 / NBRC 10599 / NRRL Y-10934 / UCD 77-7) TaxID=1071380 RepID=I2GWB9_HENB6|nr:hypothetical protein TBLA_0A06300 [Tetrapisispora blattae CBS 6284]CCH58421.1 hypothetical protein TBLA_0A06300 [Tetrapisispora blattae CBS 6284]
MQGPISYQQVDAQVQAHVQSQVQAQSEYQAQYRQTQNEILNLQATILNSANSANNISRPHDHLHILPNDLDNRMENGGARNNEIDNFTFINNSNVLNFVASKYKKVGDQENQNLGTLFYHPFKTGFFNIEDELNNSKQRELEVRNGFGYDYTLPRPFLPNLNTNDINKIITIKINYEDYISSMNRDDINSPRSNNNEIWGCDIYTDDTDPILALIHCGFTLNNINKFSSTDKKIDEMKFKMTPVNINNTNNIFGILPIEEDMKFDIELDILILPSLENYYSIRRNNITSRNWGALIGSTCHDGLSYGIYKIALKLRDDSTNGLTNDQHILDNTW